MFGIDYSSSKCKILLQDCSESTTELIIGNEAVEKVDHVAYLGSLINLGGLVPGKILAWTRLALANLHKLWLRRNVSRVRVYLFLSFTHEGYFHIIIQI